MPIMYIAGCAVALCALSPRFRSLNEDMAWFGRGADFLRRSSSNLRSNFTHAFNVGNYQRITPPCLPE
jgi:hypothetical protein